ncbi:MAG: NADPH:quinone reductase and related Zn-dependent oxidoreductase [Ilumatobacteraceae bacterium]|nr:NADPH:quinone reductase and related Zn-dependent oxidoreductase [Ilumatobacteraceae bacterium]
MKAVRFHEFGDPSVLQIDDIDIPEPAAGQVRVRVAATSFNPVEGNIRAGYMQGPIPVTLPHTPGIDLAGTVDALGEGVTGLSVGDPVIGFLPMAAPGAAAEYAIAPAEVLTAAPTNVPLVEAAALPLVGLTAYQALFEHADLQSDQRVLVNGAGGAVGGYAVQLAREAGAYVIATASGDSLDRAKAAGAHEVIDYAAADVASSLEQQVDALVNLAPISPEQFEALVARVRDGGVVVSTTAWMPTPGDDARAVRAITMYVRSDANQLAQLVAAVNADNLQIVVTERVPLDQLAALHAKAAADGISGKAIVVV